jgi:hypothetical protein
MHTEIADPAFLDTDTASDRAGTICMVALFEDMLSDAIRNRLVRLSKQEDARMFGERGCIGTLAAKIDIGYAIGLYGVETMAVLHNARRIRNKFAHLHEADSFDHPEVQRISCKLPGCEPGRAGEARSNFNKALLAVAMRLKTVPSTDDEGRPAAPAELP